LQFFAPQGSALSNAINVSLLVIPNPRRLNLPFPISLPPYNTAATTPATAASTPPALSIRSAAELVLAVPKPEVVEVPVSVPVGLAAVLVAPLLFAVGLAAPELVELGYCEA